MRRPGVCAGMISCLGIVVASSRTPLPHIAWVLGPLVSTAFWLMGRRLRVRSVTGLAPICFLLSGTIGLASASFYNFHAATAPAGNDIARWSRQAVDFPMIVEGRLRSYTERTSGIVEVVVDVLRVSTGADPVQARGALLVRLRASSDADRLRFFSSLHPGDAIRLQGFLRAISSPGNPYDFDAADFYARSGISALFILAEPAGTDAGDPPLRLLRHQHEGLSYVFGRLRTRAGTRINRIHHTPAAKEVVPALLIGDRSRISSSSRTVFRDSGLAHLLAISGLHVGILGVLFYWVAGLVTNPSWIRRRPGLIAKCLFTFVGLLFYGVFTGGSPSVSRAVVMSGVLLLGKSLERSVQGWNTLGMAGITLLFLWPSDLYLAGFQLSFSAVAGILYFSPRLRLNQGILGALPSLLKQIIGLLAVSAAVSLATLPVMMYHFGSAALGGLVANVIAIPLTALLLISSILSLLTGSLLHVGQWFSWSTDLLASLLYATARTASQVLGHLKIVSIVSVLCFAVFGPLLGWMFMRLPRRAPALWGTGCLLFVVLWAPRSEKTVLRVDFLDVGQGDAIVLILPSGKTILVDAGWGTSSAGIIARHLTRLGKQKIDLLVVSHFHQDHTGGIPALIETVPVSLLVVPFGGAAGGVEPSFLSRAAQAIIPIREVRRGDMIRVDDAIRLQVLSPDRRDVRSINENERSVVLRLVYGHTSLLLTGDVELETESRLVLSFGNYLASNLVKVAHHGSNTSSSDFFVQRAGSPDGQAVISVGNNNRFGHPSREVIDRWRSYGVAVTLTSREGAIRFTSDGNSYSRSDW